MTTMVGGNTQKIITGLTKPGRGSDGCGRVGRGMIIWIAGKKTLKNAEGWTDCHHVPCAKPMPLKHADGTTQTNTMKQREVGNVPRL